MQTLTVQLFGKAYKVRCPQGKEEVLVKTEAMLNQKIRETQRNSGLTAREDIIMMTALNLCHEEIERQMAENQQAGLESSQAAAIVKNKIKE
ncbi:MAG: cell division protein ZapA [Aestuariibacter sp.]